MHIILLLTLVLLPLSAQAGVYRCKDANGQTVMTDKPCAGAPDLQRKYGAASGQTPQDQAGDPDLVEELARRRDFYVGQGYPADIAAQKALLELSPPQVRMVPEERPQPLPPKTGGDNMRDYLNQRERDQAQLQQQQREQLQRSDALDAEREEQRRNDAKEKRRADCEHERRVNALRGGYGYTPGGCY